MSDLRAADPHVPASVLCFRCEYDLRGLPRDSRCPECGGDIEQSHQRAEALLGKGGIVPLALSARGWLTIMKLGCLMILAGTVALAGQAAITGMNNGHHPWLEIVFGLSSMVALPVGQWMLGAREPAAGAKFANSRFVRYTIRATAILWIGVPLLLIAMLGSGSARLWKLAARIDAVLTAVATMAVLLRLADASIRAGHGKIRRAMWALLVIAPAALIAQTIYDSYIVIGPNSYWELVPHPIIGFAETIVLVPIEWARHLLKDGALAIWTPQALISLALVAALAWSAWLFRRAGRVTNPHAHEMPLG